jgi:hypothetical protein
MHLIHTPQPSKVIHITARPAPMLLFWNRIVALQIRLRSYGALSLACMVISSQTENHLIGSGLASCNDESQLDPRVARFPARLPRFRWRPYATDAQHPRPWRVEL